MYNNKQEHTNAYAFLMAMAPRFSSPLQGLLAEGQVTLKPIDLYYKVNISDAGGGTYPVFKQSAKEERGIMNFNETGKLVQERGFIFDKLFFGYKADAAADKEGELIYNQVPPAALYNADLVFSQDGRSVLRKSVASLVNLGTGQHIDDDLYEFGTWLYLIDNKKVDITLEFPDGLNMPAGTEHYIYIRIPGYETNRKTTR